MNKTIANTVYKPFPPAEQAGKRLIYLTVMRQGRGEEKTKKIRLGRPSESARSID